MSAAALSQTASPSVSRELPPLAALVSPARLADLKSVCLAVTNIAELSGADAVIGQSSNLFVVEHGLPGFEQLILMLALERPGTGIILLSDQLPGHIVRALMKFQASDILPLNAGLGEIADAAERVRASQTNPKEDHASVCWAFRGAVGGAGVTTLAIEAAFDITQRLGAGKVCLVDLNVADGMVTSFLDCVPKLDLVSLSASPERLDTNLLNAWRFEHDRGLHIIAAPRNAEADLLASEAAILRLLDVACDSYDFVAVDVPRHRMPWTKPILSAVDEAIVVSELTVPSLHAAADMCRDIDGLRDGRPAAKLVLNRMFAKKQFGSSFDTDRAERAIERKIDATVTSDWDAARTAVNLGRPIAEVKPKSALVADVNALIGRWLPEALATAQTQVKAKKGRA